MTLSSEVTLAFIAFVVLFCCMIYDYLVLSVVIVPGVAGDPTHVPPILPILQSRKHRFKSFVFRWVLIALSFWMICSYSPRQAIVGVFQKRIVPAATLDDSMPIPSGFTFDPMTGELRAPEDIPDGLTLIVWYDSIKTPLKGVELDNGRIMGPGKRWVLPVRDATNISVRYYDEAKNTASQFMSPF